jgi:hypothetical protein
MTDLDSDRAQQSKRSRLVLISSYHRFHGMSSTVRAFTPVLVYVIASMARQDVHGIAVPSCFKDLNIMYFSLKKENENVL